MFNGLRREIEEILGDDFAVFAEYSTNPERNNAVLNAFKNVGVLYVNYGDLRLLPGNQGLTGSLQLDLLMCVEDGVQIESVVSKPLRDLMAHQNGEYYQDEVDGVKYNYVLNYHLPTSSGDEQLTDRCVRYVIYSLPIDVVVATNSLMLGERYLVEFEFAEDNWVQLKNVVNCVLVPNVSLDSRTWMNSGKTTSDAIAKVWGMQIVCDFDATDDLHAAIYNALEETPEKTWTIQYKPSVGDYEYITRTVIFHDSAVSFPRGQFAVLTLNLAEAS